MPVGEATELSTESQVYLAPILYPNMVSRAHIKYEYNIPNMFFFSSFFLLPFTFSSVGDFRAVEISEA